MRVNSLNRLQIFPKIDPNDENGDEIILPPITPLGYINNYTDKGAEAFIQTHIEKHNECEQTNELEKQRHDLDSFISECKLEVEKYKNTIIELINQSEELYIANEKLYAEINKSKETKSNKTGSNVKYLLELLGSFGIVMFVYCIYISL